MPREMKKMEVVKWSSHKIGGKKNEGRADLIIERDSGNPIRCLMGMGKEHWERLRGLCDEALEWIEEEH